MDDAEKVQATAPTSEEKAKADTEDLRALANKPIKIRLGEGEFSMRRMSVDDALQMEDERERLQKEGIGTNRAAMLSMLFLLSLLLQPEINYTVEQLKKMVLFEDMGYLMEKLKEAGFKAPQGVATVKSEENAKASTS